MVLVPIDASYLEWVPRMGMWAVPLDYWWGPLRIARWAQVIPDPSLFRGTIGEPPLTSAPERKKDGL